MGSRELKSSLSVKPLNEVYICVFPLCYMSFFQCQVNEVWVWQNTAHACFDISLTVAIPQSQTHTHARTHTPTLKGTVAIQGLAIQGLAIQGLWQFQRNTHTHTHTHTHARARSSNAAVVKMLTCKEQQLLQGQTLTKCHMPRAHRSALQR